MKSYQVGDQVKIKKSKDLAKDWWGQNGVVQNVFNKNFENHKTTYEIYLERSEMAILFFEEDFEGGQTAGHPYTEIFK